MVIKPIDTVDILMATYNGEKYLLDMLDSIEKQTYESWTLIVRDDNSSDNTVKILEKFQSKYPDKVKLYVNSPATGCARDNFLKLFNDAKSDYIMCCDQDDYWLSNKIEVTLQKMKSIEKKDAKIPALVHTDLYVVDQGLNMVNNSFFKFTILPKKLNGLQDLLIQNTITGCTMMINAALKKLLCKEFNKDNIIMHDWIAGMLAISFGKIGFVDQATIKYRQHGGNVVGAKDSKSISYIIQQVKKGKHHTQKLIYDTTIQAKEFLAVYGDCLNVEDRKMLDDYSHLYDYGKVKRIRIYNKYKIKKYGLVRRLGQYIWG